MRRPWLSRRAVVATVAGLAVVVAGTSAWAMSGGGTTYRDATATRGSVTETLTTTGAISPVREADLDFQVKGSVGRVLVHAGDHVTTGERVAQLDRTSLKAAVTSARSTVDAAQASLTSDENSQTSVSSTSSSSGRSSTSTSSGPQPTTSSSPSPTGGSGSGAAGSAKLRRDQKALIDAQRQADQDLARAKTALATTKSACAAETTGSSTSSSSGATDSDATTCTAATRALLADQTTVSSDQAKVQTAEQAVSQDLAGASTGAAPAKPTAANDTASTAGSLRSATTATLTAAITRSDASAATADSPTAGNSASTGIVTAARLASDQATIDTDLATLRSARADMRQAALTSPINGRVAAVTISRGDAVSGSSSATSPAVEIVGSRQSQVSISVPATQLRTLRDGMSARITPDGADRSVTGKVSAIGLTSTTDSTTGSSTYPVVVTISRSADRLIAGSDAAVSIVTSTADNVVTVPTSAVHRSGSRSYVELATAAGETRHAVTVGTVGAQLTEIRSGLQAGERVVLADLDAAVPSSSSNTQSQAGSGGFGGGNFRINIAPGSASGGPPGGSFQSGL
jgi:HlyD family secretion protein